MAHDTGVLAFAHAAGEASSGERRRARLRPKPKLLTASSTGPALSRRLTLMTTPSRSPCR
jgi:hypothetical protein